MNRDIVDYYDRLAPSYDQSRFGNSYGRFVDARERALLAKWLPAGDILDIACGTGRLSDFASTGCDASLNSLRLASQRHGAVSFVQADATRLPFADGRFAGATAFHLLMHLDQPSIRLVFTEASRTLEQGGVFVVDILSARRRNLGFRRQEGWHGSSALDARAFAAMGKDAGLRLTALEGILTLPIHRLPARLRPALASADRWLGTRFPEAASYLVARFEKIAP